MKSFSFLVVLLAWGASQAIALPVARLRGVRAVTQVQNERRGWKMASERGALVFGDTVRTDTRGGADLLFNNGTRITLRSRSQLQILAPASEGKPLVVRVFGALSEVFVRAKGPTEIRTAAGTAAVRGTEYSVKIGAENETSVTVSEGEVAFFNPQGEVLVGVNQQSSAVVGTAPTAPVAVDASGLLSWTLESAGLPLELENRFANPQNEGERFFNAGHIPQAIRFFESGDPRRRSAENWGSLGRVQLAAGDLRGARIAFEQSLTLNSEMDRPIIETANEAKIGLALVALSRGDLSATRLLDVARAQLAGAENSPRGALVLGLISLRAGDSATAQTDLQRASTLNAADYEAQSLYSIALLQNGDAKTALLAAQTATKIAPDSALSRAALSLALFFGGDATKARAQAKRALQIDPFSPLALLAYGRSEAALGDLDEAQQATEQAAALAPEFPLVQRDLGAIYTRLERLPKAEAAFRAVLSKNPRDGSALAGLGTVLSQTGREIEAQTAFESAISLAPRDASVRAQYAGFLIEQGQLERARTEAEAFLQTVQSGGRELGAIFIRLSEEALYRQNLRDAFRYGQRAVELLPQSAPAHYQLGRVFLEQDRTVQAQNQFRLATALDPNLARARYAVGLTQEMIASGRDVSRPLGQIAAANESGPGQALSVQNLATPGANQRLQAAIADPTVIRTATRSYGDTQIDGAIGEDGVRVGNLSVLKESRNRRGLIGVSATHDENDGVREGAGFQAEKYGIVVGQKRRDSASGFFGLAQTESIELGSDTGLVSSPRNAPERVEYRKPLIIAGYNQQWSQKARTRFLLQGDEARQSIAGSTFGNTLDANYRGFHGEVRHDMQLGETHLLSAGASVGRRTFESRAFNPPPPMTPFSAVTSTGDETVRQLLFYVRDEWLATPKLRVTGELKGQKVNDRFNSSGVFDPAPPPPAPASFANNNNDEKFVGLPTLLLSYQASPRTNIRARARRIFGGIFDFESLSPADVFLFDATEAPLPNFLGRGSVYEAEISHSFADASLLRIGAFQQSATATTNEIANTGELLLDGRFRGIRAGYEGIVSSQLTYFLNAGTNSASGTLDFGLGGLPIQQFFSSVPRVQGEVGLQYLSDRGFFVQPTLAYIGSRFEPDDGDAATPRPKLGGFGLFNARIGKRAGLRSVVFVEALNLLDKTFATQGGVAARLQPGRQFRVGASYRF